MFVSQTIGQVTIVYRNFHLRKLYFEAKYTVNDEPQSHICVPPIIQSPASTQLWCYTMCYCTKGNFTKLFEHNYRTCIGPNFSKLGVRNETSVSLTTCPSASTKPLVQANRIVTVPVTDAKPIPII